MNNSNKENGLYTKLDFRITIPKTTGLNTNPDRF